MKLTNPLPQLPRLRTHGAVPPLLHMWCLVEYRENFTVYSCRNAPHTLLFMCVYVTKNKPTKSVLYVDWMCCLKMIITGSKHVGICTKVWYFVVLIVIILCTCWCLSKYKFTVFIYLFIDLSIYLTTSLVTEAVMAMDSKS